MKVSDRFFVLEKIEKYLREDIYPSRRRKVHDIPFWKYFETGMDTPLKAAGGVDFDDSGWSDFIIPGTWGGYDRQAWFRAKVEIPADWKKEDSVLAAAFLVGPRDGGDSTAESLLYVDGKAVQGIDIWHEEALLDESCFDKTHLTLALNAWSGVLGVPDRRTFKRAQLLLIDSAADAFYFKADTLCKCAKQIAEGDLCRIALTKALNKAFARVNFLHYLSDEYYRSLVEALAVLDEELDSLASYTELKPTVTGTGHSHIDMAWLWRLRATRDKASRTFATMLNLMRQYPDFKFMHSSPQLYKFLSEDHPDIFEDVRQRIASGQWEITGGMWVEPDTNIPSGESLVRQLLFGTRYIRETSGKETNLVWLPDVFGYSGALPQILKKSGMKYFMTTKISWNQYNHFPYDTFLWRGIDGSEILTHFITTPENGSWYYTYNGQMTPEEVTGIWKNYKDKDKNSDLLLAYGWGDGGGGPTREMIESARVMKNIPGIPNVKLDNPESYFRSLSERVSGLNTWKGELYFEYHRGTYTSQGRMKRENFLSERTLHELEALWSLADILGGSDRYPRHEINRLWERVLLNQFHDIIPGSSIRQVYEDAHEDFVAFTETAGELAAQAERELSALLPAGQYVFNAQSCPQTALVPLETGDLVLVRDIPAYGVKRLTNTQPELTGTFVITEKLIETPFHRITLGDNGEITELFDKRIGHPVSGNAPMNRFVAYEDKPQRFDAWDIDIYYREKPYPAFTLISARVEEQGSLRGVLTLVWRFSDSTVTQKLTVYRHIPRIDFVTRVDWREKQTLLKVYFPTNIHADRAAYQIQFGNLERPAHTNTEYDFAQFEVCGHHWADLSESGYGLSLLSDCKYGYDIHDGVMSLTLLKSSTRPDETADRCIHEFTYGLYSHAGTWREAQTEQQAAALCYPPRLIRAEGAGTPSEAVSFFTVDCENVWLDTVKRAEDERATILRLHEYKNCSRQTVRLTTLIPVKKAVETDLMEREIGAVTLEGGDIVFGMSGYEIKTLKVWF